MESSPIAEGAVETQSVGRRLRSLREARGISLSALARRAGVGKATLSGLETGTRNPTLETLFAVAAALELPLASLLAGPGSEPRQRGDGPMGAIAMGIATPPRVHGAGEANLLQVFDDEAVTYELYRMRIAPGPVQTSPAHHKGVTEYITVFSGVLRAGPVDATMDAGSGEHLSWTSDVPHTYVALGDADVHASLLMRYPKPYQAERE